MTIRKKKLYAILWVDDYGSSPLPNKFVDWFHKNAGPISFAVETGDRFTWSFRKVIKGKMHDFSYDYLSHHYHALEWTGNRLVKGIYDLFQLNWWVYGILGSIRLLRLPKRAFRLLYGGILAGGLVALVVMWLLFKPLFAALAILYLAALGVLALWFYVQSSRSWRNHITDDKWHEYFLAQTSRHFQDLGYSYPAVVRHGWNLPPENTMRLYLGQLGVLADASATPTEKESQSRVNGREILWERRHPYYASLKGDFNMPWDGENEDDRGILEVPVVLGNIGYYGFADREKALIETLPEDSLVAAYMHPWDDFSPVQKWANHMKERYDTVFVRADTFVADFIGRHPRPILIDASLKACWAFQAENGFQSIREIEADTISCRHETDEGQDGILVSLRLNTSAEVPILAFASSRVVWEGETFAFEPINGQCIYRNVPPGDYRLRLEN